MGTLDSVEFTKRVDTKGRLVIPKEVRQALSIEGREALVECEVQTLTYLDDDEGGDS